MEKNNLDILLEIEKEFKIENNYYYEVLVEENKKKSNIFKTASFTLKYLFTSLLIFTVLLFWTNYNAYLNIAKWYFFKEEFEKEEKNILNTVQASNLKEKLIEKNNLDESEDEKWKKESLNIKKYKQELDEKNISLNIEITPYENRIVIPKLWKNIPLLDIKNQKIDSEHELENIFMKELENWVIRYPGSAVPWENWNSFIFWHSSNFPWMKWNYNDVFSNLNFLESWDEIIIYYWQKKFIYIIKEKKVIKPWDISVLKRSPEKKELSIMTCWPIWTTLNRLIVIWEIKEEK